MHPRKIRGSCALLPKCIDFPDCCSFKWNSDSCVPNYREHESASLPTAPKVRFPELATPLESTSVWGNCFREKDSFWLKILKICNLKLFLMDLKQTQPGAWRWCCHAIAACIGDSCKHVASNGGSEWMGLAGERPAFGMQIFCNVPNLVDIPVSLSNET